MARMLILATTACALIAFPALAAPAVTAVAASDYISKGASKTDGRPHASLRLEQDVGPGYAGAWWGNVKTSQGSDSEIHLYAGVRREWAGVALDGAALFKILPGDRDGVDGEHWEFRLDATKRLGPNALRLRAEYTPDGYASARQAWWLEAQVSRKLTARLSAVAAVGAREQAVGADYTAWNAGLRFKLSDRADLDLRWHDTDSHGLGGNYDGRVVATVSAGF